MDEEKVAASVAALNNFDADGFTTIVGLVYAFLAQQGSPAEIMAQIDAFSEQRRVKNSQLKTVVRTLLTLLRTGLKKNAVAKQIYEEFVQLGLANEKAEEIATLWNANLVNMSRSLVGQTLSVNKLVDLDWRFGVTAGTDSLRQAGTTFLQLKLALDKGNSQTESVFMELTLPQFYQFLKDMEQAKSALDYYS